MANEQRHARISVLTYRLRPASASPLHGLESVEYVLQREVIEISVVSQGARRCPPDYRQRPSACAQHIIFWTLRRFAG